MLAMSSSEGIAATSILTMGPEEGLRVRYDNALSQALGLGSSQQPRALLLGSRAWEAFLRTQEGADHLRGVGFR